MIAKSTPSGSGLSDPCRVVSSTSRGQPASVMHRVAGDALCCGGTGQEIVESALTE
jgi:hypothetical protein